VLPIGRCAVTDTKLSQANGDVSETGSGRGRRALRRAADVFLRLYTWPTLQPFSPLARRLAALHTT
jgi:hypothetical protein